MTRPQRILLAKPGLDGHDRGVLVVAAALRDAGFEVIYTGLRQTPEMIASAARDEDVDAVGLSSLSGAHRTLVPQVIDKLREFGMEHVRVAIGGIIPEEDRQALVDVGVHAVFGPGTASHEIVAFFGREAAGEPTSPEASS